MKHLKKFNESINEEFFGGPIEDLMNPKIDKLIEVLTDLKGKLNGVSGSTYSQQEVNKVEHMYNYLIDNIDLDTLSSSSRQNVYADKESIVDRVKRSVKNF